MAIVDVVAKDVFTLINLSEGNSTLILNNVKLDNVDSAVSVGGNVLLEGGSKTIDIWAQGNVYSGNKPNSTGTFVQGDITKPSRPNVLLDNEGRIFGKAHPQ